MMAEYICPDKQTSCGLDPATWCDGCQCPAALEATDSLGGETADDYGNPLSGDRTINCCFPDCGCDGARLCQAENGPSSAAYSLNRERGRQQDATDRRKLAQRAALDKQLAGRPRPPFDAADYGAPSPHC